MNIKEAQHSIDRRAAKKNYTGAQYPADVEKYTAAQLVAYRRGYDFGYRAGNKRNTVLKLETEVVNLRAKLAKYENPRP